ncbi:MAG: DUF423 domain-containing protein [Bacteroidetes bacterium]|nr:DUF423 domain-containing protein [Bacteroidota bacterium]
MNRCFMIIGAVAGAVAVGLGAFGTHGLKDQISVEMLHVYQTGVEYLIIHAVVLLVTGWIGGGLPQRMIRASGIAFIVGMVLFSGSLLMLATTGLRALGAVAPVGGAAFITGWLLLAAALWRKAS